MATPVEQLRQWLLEIQMYRDEYTDAILERILMFAGNQELGDAISAPSAPLRSSLLRWFSPWVDHGEW